MSKAEAAYRRLLLFEAWRRSARLPLSLRVADVGSWVKTESGVDAARRGVARVLRISLALPLDEQIELLARHRPHIVSGYPSALEILAEAFRSASAPFSLRLVATRGEVLHDRARRTIGAAFGCAVADYYNCEEVGNVAWQCPRDATVYHANTDACVLEIVDAHGDPVSSGAEGQVLVTNLYNCTMPFIRYALHDRAAWIPASRRPCGCGHHGPSIGLLSGRDDDVVYMPSGGRVSPRLVATAVDRAFDAVTAEEGVERLFRRFQVVQDALDHLSIAIIPGTDRRAPFEEILAPTMRRLDPKLRCSVRLVDELPLEASGKFKKVVQAMSEDARSALSR